ncbi:hypothetical protein KUTeg_008942 [Tegillarca granosa]|uniref:G-protein coupled receptors family 1 profile domain-containing protein n=1 Tax=Tegillarca granosa TaxID=220873 RepID=A0ABQ9FDT8_TEGGR|nr:hypothetical protein KUTeg_008942 [Tegillarca granosa]
MEMNFTFFSYNPNTTDTGFYANFANIINASSWANLKAQNLHERAKIILMQPETILTLFLCLAALLANIFSICATSHNPNGMTTHSKLIISLAVSDILTALNVFTHILNKVFNAIKMPPLFTPEERLTSSCMFAFVNAFNTSVHLISLLNLIAMAIDHYIAIMKPLHYSHLMSRVRGNIMIICLWFLAFFGGVSNFLSGISSFKSEMNYVNYCEFIMYNEFHGEYLVIGTTFLTVVAITYIYIRIYCEVKTLNCRIPHMRKDCLHNKKAMVTTLLIIGTFGICWLPSCLFQIAIIIQIHVDADSVNQLFGTLLRANKYLYALLLFNSLCDPIIYAVRLKYIQIGYYRFLAHCLKFYELKLQKQGYEGRKFIRRGTTTRLMTLDVEAMAEEQNNEAEMTPMTTTTPITESQITPMSEFQTDVSILQNGSNLINNNQENTKKNENTSFL